MYFMSYVFSLINKDAIMVYTYFISKDIPQDSLRLVSIKLYNDATCTGE